MMIISSKLDQRELERVSLWLDGLAIPQSACDRNLGVLFDPLLCSDNHVRSITKTAFFHLRNLAKIKPMLSAEDAETLEISSRLVYCHSVFSGLQLVQNAAATLLTRTRKFDHITPILASLHWLPISSRSDVKVLLLTYKAPSYLKDLIIPYSPSRTLRSSGARLSLPKVKKIWSGRRRLAYRVHLRSGINCSPLQPNPNPNLTLTLTLTLT